MRHANPEALAEGPCSVIEPAHVHQLLCHYLQRLTEASSRDGFFAELSACGADFHMPYLNIVLSYRNGASPHLQQIYRSPEAPELLVDALSSHPLYDWARESEVPVSLSDLDDKLALRGLTRAKALATIEGLFINLRVASHQVIHYAFFGEHGSANGLARSLLLLAARFAHESFSRPTSVVRTPASPAAAGAAPTPREREILDYAMEGLTDAEIGRALGLVTRTVRFHLKNMKRKAGASTRAELIARVAQRGPTRR